MNAHPRIIFLILLAGTLFVYLFGAFLPVMELDSAQDATMAMYMAEHNSYLELIKFHHPYLDKPHLHFWLSALSFEIFGVSEWAYRLPSILLLFLAAYTTYRLGKLLYHPQIGLMAAFIFLLSQTIILSAHDVRTDAVLTAFIAISIWLWTEYIHHQKTIVAFLAGISTGLAFDAKGWLGPLYIGMFVLSFLLLHKQWKAFFRWQTFSGFIGFLLAISPVLWAYYVQFDLHPEIEIEGQKNISGVKFILWDQVFNRMQAKGYQPTGEDYFFFFHSLIWMFLPLSIFFYMKLLASWSSFKEQIKHRQSPFFIVLGFTIIMLLISFSKFKLPHYLNGLIPMLSLFVAYHIHNQKNIFQLKIAFGVQYFIAFLVFIAVWLINSWVFPLENFWSWLVLVFSTLIFVGLLIIRYSTFKHLFVVASITSIFLNLNLNIVFYPKLLRYQGGLQLAEWCIECNIPRERIFLLEPQYNWSFDFYMKNNTPVKTWNNAQTGDYLVCNNEQLKSISTKSYRIVKEVNHFPVTRLSLEFLNPKTRNQTLEKIALIQKLH